MSENPFIDDRDIQQSLSIGESASRTSDRDSKLLSGSGSFLDDRDDSRSNQEQSEQSGLFSETEEIEDQQTLFGSQATEQSEGFFSQSEPQSDEPLLDDFERYYGAEEIKKESPAVPGASLFDVSIGPDEAFGRVGIGGSGDSMFDPLFGEQTDTRQDAPPGLSAVEPTRVDLEIESNIADASAAGALDPQRKASGGVREVDLGKLDSANTVRERFGQYLHENDHRGRTTVKFVAQAPQSVINQAELIADEVKAETARSQSSGLTNREREVISNSGGFKKNVTTANWRSAKGVFEREGLADQFRDEIGGIADYEDPIEGAEAAVERHKRRMQESGVGGIGAMDMGEEDIQQRQRAGAAAAREQQSIEEHAIKGAKKGHQEAIDALVFEAGWDRGEAEALAGRVEDPRDPLTESQFKEIVEVEILRAGSNGRFVKKEPQPVPTLDNFRSITNGQFVGDEFSEPDIARDATTGRFVSGDR